MDEFLHKVNNIRTWIVKHNVIYLYINIPMFLYDCLLI